MVPKELLVIKFELVDSRYIFNTSDQALFIYIIMNHLSNYYHLL